MKSNKFLIVDDMPMPLAMSRVNLANVIKAHEATGQTTMREHESRMKNAVTKSIQGDVRFMPKEDVSDAARSMGCKPYCLDVTTPDTEGQHHAIIRNHEGKLVKHAFDYDHEEGTATMHDGQPSETERKEIYATEIDRHENMVKAMAETLACRAADGNGIKLSAAEPWTPGKSVTYIYVPGGISTINAGFRRNESITCTVNVDDLTAKDLQESFDFIAATEKQEPYADEDHEGKKATLRFPARKVNFTYGTHRNEEGVIVSGAEPTTYGADSVNGKIYASWSPEFATDADYSKAKCKKGHWTFPDGIRGSASNPARIVAVSFVTGALTNKPAFKNMPPVKAKLTLPPVEDDAIQATWSEEARTAAAEARKNKAAHASTEAESSSQKAHAASSKAMETKSREHHAVAEKAHKDAAGAHAIASNRYADSSEKSKEHWNKMKEHLKHADNHSVSSDKTTATDAAESDALRAAEATTDAGKSGQEKVTATDEPDSLLAIIFARHKQGQDYATAIAAKSPDVQARLKAAAEKPDTTVANIAAREEQNRAFERTLVARSPLAANRETLQKITERNKEAVTA